MKSAKVLKLEEDKDTSVRTSSDLVRWCENMLGWLPPEDKPVWKSRSVEAGKLNRKRKGDRKMTIANLLLAGEYCRAHRIEIKSPVALCFYVEKAMKLAQEQETVSDLAADMTAALTYERALPEPDPTWVTRLIRAQGDVRAEVLEEWRQARGFA